MYVDDSVRSVPSSFEGWRIFLEGKLLLREAGFNLRKWATNDERLRKAIVEEECGKKEYSERSQEEFIKVLGMKWHQYEDTLHFDVTGLKDFLSEKQPTKRIVLSAMARIFDPLGIVAPFTVRLKVLFQKLWKMNYAWDEELKPPLKNDWNQWMLEIPDLQMLSVPRCFSLRSEGDVSRKFHAFCDASEQVYGAVIYIVERRGNIKTSMLVASKNRVAPIKSLSIPRLELMAALICVRLVEKCSIYVNSCIILDGLNDCFTLDSWRGQEMEDLRGK